MSIYSSAFILARRFTSQLALFTLLQIIYSSPLQARPSICYKNLAQIDFSQLVLGQISISGYTLSPAEKKRLLNQVDPSGKISNSTIDSITSNLQNILSESSQTEHTIVNIQTLPVSYCPQKTEAGITVLDIFFEPYQFTLDLTKDDLPVIRLRLPSGLLFPAKANFPIKIDYDRSYGTSLAYASPSIGLSRSKSSNLTASVYARKSLEYDFANYEFDANLASRAKIRSKNLNKALSAYQLDLEYLNNYIPQGNGSYWEESYNATASLAGRAMKVPLTEGPLVYRVGASTSLGNYNSSVPGNGNVVNGLFQVGAFAGVTSALNNPLGEGNLGVGIVGSYGVNESSSGYGRGAILSTYASTLYPFDRGSKKSSLERFRDPSLELSLFSAIGGSTGVVPQSQRYFAGYIEPINTRDFMQHLSNNKAVFSPVLRSAGYRQIGLASNDGNLNGGTSFWNISTSTAIAIPAWSKPAVPNTEICENMNGCEDGSTRTLYDYLMEITRKSINPAAATLAVARKKDFKDAYELLKPIYNEEIIPAMETLLFKTKTYAIKPVLFIDALGLRSESLYDTWIGVGAGLQFNLLNSAYLEAGFMKAVVRGMNSDSDNFFLRLNLLNLDLF